MKDSCINQPCILLTVKSHKRGGRTTAVELIHLLLADKACKQTLWAKKYWIAVTVTAPNLHTNNLYVSHITQCYSSTALCISFIMISCQHSFQSFEHFRVHNIIFLCLENIFPKSLARLLQVQFSLFKPHSVTG